MGWYQQQRSRSTAGIEPHIRQWKTYKKERAGKRFKRQRERDGKKISVDDRSKYLNGAFQIFLSHYHYSVNVKTKFPPK